MRHDIAHSYAPLYDTDAYVPASGADTPNAPGFSNRAAFVPQGLQGGSLNQHAVAWDPMGGVAFASGTTQPGEIPFDDM